MGLFTQNGLLRTTFFTNDGLLRLLYDPTLVVNLDLKTNTLPSGLTFSRASAATDVINGVLTSFASGSPRISVENGLLIEEQRTNNLISSTITSSSSYWLPSQTFFTENADTSPDGTANATKVTESYHATTAFWHQFYPGAHFSYVSGTTYTMSVFAKAGERNRFGLYFPAAGNSAYAIFDLLSGSVVANSGDMKSGITPLANGWYRCWVTATATATATATSLNVRLVQSGTNINYVGDGISGLYIFGAQLENGGLPTSYIPTTTAAATRAADVCYGSVPGLTTGTIVIEAKSPDVFASSAWNVLFDVNNGASDTNKFFGGAYNGTSDVQSVVGGSAVFTGTCGVWPVRTVQKLGCSFGPNDFITCRNGTLSTPDTTGSVASGLTNINIGYERWGGRYWNGYVRSIKLYNKRKSNTELQALTA